MTRTPQRDDTYNLPNTARGRELLVHLMESHTHHNIPFRVSHTVVEGTSHPVVLLTLEKLGKRPGEGVIAAGMKARRA